MAHEDRKTFPPECLQLIDVLQLLDMLVPPHDADRFQDRSKKDDEMIHVHIPERLELPAMPLSPYNAGVSNVLKREDRDAHFSRARLELLDMFLPPHHADSCSQET